MVRHQHDDADGSNDERETSNGDDPLGEFLVTGPGVNHTGLVGREARVSALRAARGNVGLSIAAALERTAEGLAPGRVPRRGTWGLSSAADLSIARLASAGRMGPGRCCRKPAHHHPQINDSSLSTGRRVVRRWRTEDTFVG